MGGSTRYSTGSSVELTESRNVMIGRQAFEDAAFEKEQDTKLRELYFYVKFILRSDILFLPFNFTIILEDSFS